MKKMARSDLPELLGQLDRSFEVYTPQQLAGTTRVYAPLGSGSLALAGDRPPQSPKGIFFPTSQALFRYEGQELVPVDHSPERPIGVFGLSAADAAAISYLDRFFTRGFADDVYLERRRDSVLATLVGEHEGGPEFSPAASPGLFDLQFAGVGDDLYVTAGSLKGSVVLDRQTAFFEPVADGREIVHYIRERSRPSPSLQQIARAAVLLRAGRVAEELWSWVADRCLACGGCSYVCPTCTCFDVWDRGGGGRGARVRSWDSCILSGFSREGSNHNPRGRASQRNRRRIEHKLMWDGAGPGGVACVGCGRCEDVCPSGLGMPVFARQIVEQADRRGEVILGILDRAADEPRFMAGLAERGSEALAGYDLTPLEKAAVQSGDARWLESYVAQLDANQKVWPAARLEQEDWHMRAEIDLSVAGSAAEQAPEPLVETVQRSAVDRMAWRPDWLVAPAKGAEPEVLVVLERAARDMDFSARLLAEGSAALEGYGLSLEEQAAIVSGDVRWLEAHLGPLSERQKEWLFARLEVMRY